MRSLKRALLCAGLLLSQGLSADTTVFAAASLTDALNEIAALKATVETLEQQLADVRRHVGMG